MLIKKSLGKRGFGVVVFKLVIKALFEKLTISVWLSVFVFTGYNQSLQRESNFILFCTFNYVTYINPHPFTTLTPTRK